MITRYGININNLWSIKWSMNSKIIRKVRKKKGQEGLVN